MTISRSILNQDCKPYNHVFSPLLQAADIKDYGFELAKRSPAKKCHETKEWLQKGARCPVIHIGEDNLILEEKDRLTPEKFEQISTPKGIVELNKEGIEMAIERRVALFFHQAILCHNMTSFTFHLSGASDQIGTSPSILFTCQDGRESKHKREAAHSSTLPTLIAKAKDGSTPNGFVYLKGGSSHAQHNATIGMHECVNGADELVDGKDKGLRDTAIKILNKVASDGLDPIKATKRFLNCFKNEVNQVKNRLDDDDKRRFVLIKYEEKIACVIEAMQEDDKFFDYLLGVAIDDEDSEKEAKIRSVIYKKRFDIIRAQEALESKIERKIDLAKRRLPKRNQSYLEDALLKEFKNSPYRKVFEKMWGKTAAVFDDHYAQKDTKAYKVWMKKIENLQINFKDTLDVLGRSIRSDFRTLQCSEFSYRAKVMRDLRVGVNNWTQKDFAQEYRNKTGINVSQSWVSRLEQLSRIDYKAAYQTPICQRRSYINLHQAQSCAKTLDVDIGLFLPFIITSN
jgi:hypothetical protein